MKSILILALLMIPVLALGQSEKSCCSPTSIQTNGSGPNQMAMLGGDPSFVKTHEAPLPTSFTPTSGAFITFKTADMLDGRTYEVKSPKPSNKFVFMFHEWWGVNEYIQQQAEQLQKELGDVTVLALDLYDGKVTTSPEEAGRLTQSVKNERAVNIIKGAVDYVGPDAKIATIGWCFGGSWSHQAALIAGKHSIACVIYYGMPEMDVEQLKTLHAPVLGIFAKQDGWITPEKVKEFEKAMKKAGKQLTVKMYAAVHAFANPSNPKHDKKAAEDAYKQTIEFFKKHLK